MTAMLEIKGLKTEVVTAEGRVTLIDDINLDLAAGEVMGLVGESGSGKSVTGLSIMGLIDKPAKVTAGQILFKGRICGRSLNGSFAPFVATGLP